MSLRWKLLLPFVIILAATGVQLTIMTHLTRSQETDTLRVNVAGRQRMLSQKLNKEILLFLADGNPEHRAAAEATAATLEMNLRVLAGGGEADLGQRKVTLPPTDDREIKAELEKAAGIWNTVRLSVNGILAGQVTDRVAAGDAVSRQLDEVRAAFDAVTALYEQESARRSKRDLTLIYLCLVAYGVTIAVTAYLTERHIIRPMRRLRDGAAAIARGDLTFEL
ncbi:MAG: type IV pili methyl-accepting chemotaxis transducer N-terminal domain-containing protein [Desulfotomaculales bacterium]